MYTAREPSCETIVPLLPFWGGWVVEVVVCGARLCGENEDPTARGVGNRGRGLLSTRRPLGVSRSPAAGSKRDGKSCLIGLGVCLRSQSACEPPRSPVSACVQRVGVTGRRHDHAQICFEPFLFEARAFFWASGALLVATALSASKFSPRRTPERAQGPIFDPRT